MSEAVQEQFNHIRDTWEEFADNKEARVLCWSVGEDGFDLMKVFFEYEGSESKELPHLFLPCDIPLDNPEEVDHLLNESLNAHIQELTDDDEFEEEMDLLSQSKTHVANLSLMADSLEDLADIVCVNLFGQASIVHNNILPLALELRL